MNILIFLPGLKLPFVKYPFHHLPLTMGRAKMEQRGRKANIPLKMISKRGETEGLGGAKMGEEGFHFLQPFYPQKRGSCIPLDKEKGKEGEKEPNHYHLHVGRGACALTW